MSPEILAKQEIDIEDASKIDMFSLGVMLYNLAFGDFPYGLNINLMAVSGGWGYKKMPRKGHFDNLW